MVCSVLKQKPIFVSSIIFVLFIVGALLLPNVTYASVSEFIYTHIVVNLLGFLVAGSASLLNFATNTFVIGFGGQFNGGVGSVVDQSWAVLRDLFNLTFIFGLVYIGFKMILGSDGRSTRKWLINIILAALLVNFSLFVSKFIIDFTNILSVELINLGIAEQIFVSGGTPNTVDISQSMEKMLKVSTSFDQNSDLTQFADGNGFAFIFGTALVFIVTIFVYISAALLLIVRAAVLTVLMILSPFLFIGMVFPNFSGAASKLWRMLFSRAFFAPVYFALLFICLSVAGGFVSSIGQSTGQDGNMAGSLANVTANAANAEADFTSTFGPFLIIIVLLFISLVAAQKMGVEGGDRAVKVGNSLARRGGRAVAQGAGGFAARGTARASRAAERNYNRLQRTSGMRFLNETKTGKAIKTTAKTAVAVGTLGASTAILNDKNIRATMKAGQNASIAGSETLNQQEKREASVQREINDHTRKDQNNKDFNKNVQTITDVSTSSADLNTAMQELAKTIRSMSDDELTSLSVEQLTNRNTALNLDDKKIDVLEKSGKYTTDQIRSIKDARKAAQINVATTGTATVVDETATVRQSTNTSMRSASNAPTATPDQQQAFLDAEEMRSRLVANSDNTAKMPVEVFTNPEMYRYITPKAVEKRISDVTESERIQIRDALSINLGVAPGSPPPAGTAWAKWYDKSPEAARLFS